MKVRVLGLNHFEKWASSQSLVTYDINDEVRIFFEFVFNTFKKNQARLGLFNGLRNIIQFHAESLGSFSYANKIERLPYGFRYLAYHQSPIK